MVVAAVGSVLSSMPLSELASPLESLITSRIERFQQLAEEQVSEAGHICAPLSFSLSLTYFRL